MASRSKKRRDGDESLKKFERFQDATTADRVRAALPIARWIAGDGIDRIRTGDGATAPDVAALVEQFIGYDPNHGFSEDAGWQRNHLTQMIAAFEAAFVLGIATGLMLRPEAFVKNRTKGGA